MHIQVKDLSIAQAYAKDIVCASIRATGTPKTSEEWDALANIQDTLADRNVRWLLKSAKKIGDMTK